jgi:hypothetical protein
MEFSVISVSIPCLNEYKKIDIYKKPHRLNQNTKPMAKIAQKRANSPKIRVRQPQRWGTTTPALGYDDPSVGVHRPQCWARRPRRWGTSTPVLGKITPALGTATPALGKITPVLGYDNPNERQIYPNDGHGDPNDGHRNPKEYLNNHNIGEML